MTSRFSRVICRVVSFAALLPATFMAAGCRQASDMPEVAPVTGVVTLDGNPLADATVTFSPESGRDSAGTTNEAGQYTLIYLPDVPGAKIGRHKVRIFTAYDRGPKDPPEKVPARYNVTTELSEEVKPSPNTFNFDLVSGR